MSLGFPFPSFLLGKSGSPDISLRFIFALPHHGHSLARLPHLSLKKLTHHLAPDNERTEILRWVSEAEYQKHHWNAKEDRIDGTGEWLLRRQEFQEWQASGVSSILWLHGIRK